MFTETDRIFVAAFDDKILSLDKEWKPLSEGIVIEGISLKWSPDGNLLYFFSKRDGFRCIWAQHLDRDTKRPVGSPVPVYHSHALRPSFLNVNLNTLSISIARDKIAFPMGETIGNIWMAEW
jgi:eukaryotic-like serine/threonine-protein kinase